MALRVAVVGAGACGLCAVKCCLDEGLQVTCYERSDTVGGVWNYTDQVVPGQACVMRSTVTNTSKEMMCYSDFPMPADYPNYMHHSRAQTYLTSYSRHHQLLPHIRLQHDVLCVSQAPDYSTTGRWLVEVTDVTTGSSEVVEYDAVLICSGRNNIINMPSFPGEETFQGRVMHSQEYRSPAGLKEARRVVVVGLGNTGGDLAVELSKVSQQVFLSTRCGGYIYSRLGPGGLPLDTFFQRRVFQMLPRFLLKRIVEWQLNKRFDHQLYGLQPEGGPMSIHPTINDELPAGILAGTVVVKPDIERLTATGVVFTDGTVEEDIDVVICATGFKFGFPCVQHPALQVHENRSELYKYCFPPDMPHSTLAVIGFVQPLGSLWALAEMQSRWATKVIKGALKLPSTDEMWADVRRKEAVMAARYQKTQRHTQQVDWLRYMDEIAGRVGCRPDLKRLLLTDPRLAVACYFGPCTAYQYRLHGPHAWPGARTAILTAWHRVLQPFNTRQVADRRHSLGVAAYVFIVVFIALCLKWVLGF